MTIKLILNALELDLSNYAFTFLEENNWLKENTISKFTYPIEIALTNEQNVALGNIIEQNLAVYNTLLDAMFYVLGEEHVAVLEIESIIGRTMVAQIRYGLEEFPNYNKRLSELPLYKLDLLVNIYDHASTIITQTWPAVNYNFPQVFTDSLDRDDDQWKYFDGIVNNYIAGDFITNSFDAQTNEQVNRNVMLPMPYMLHVLKVGFEDAGFDLAGEVLSDTYYQKATIFALNEFYKSFNTESDVVTLNTSQVFGDPVGNFANYFTQLPLPEPGRYKIAGNAIVRARSAAEFGITQSSFARLSFNNEVRWNGTAFSFAGNYDEKFYTVDFNIDWTGTEDTLKFSSQQLMYGIQNGVQDDEAMILDVTVTQLAKFDVNGNLIATLVEATTIDLSKTVPDMSFGEYVTAIMKKRNYGYTINGNVVSIDKREVATIDRSLAIDLSNYEVATPERNFNRGKTFELKTFDYKSEAYPQPKIFIFNNGYTFDKYTKNDDTEEIVVNAMGLPLKLDVVRTAHDFLDDNSKLLLVLYSGLADGINLAEDAEGMSLYNNYLNDYEAWFKFLLTSQKMIWVFDSSYEALYALKVRSIIYAYRQYHVIRKLTRKTYISSNKGIMLEHEIETESLE